MITKYTNTTQATDVAEDKPRCVKDIVAHCNAYKGADNAKSALQLVTTLALFAALITLMVYSISFSYIVTLLLAVPAAGLLIRIFIFQHDCGHGSFFTSKEMNTWTGRILGLLTVTPYDFWRRAHNKHHATSGDLDRRSVGGIDTITKREYEALSKRNQFLYRLYRNPIILLLIGTPFYVLILQRLPYNQATNFCNGYQSISARSIWKSVILTNIFMAVFYGSIAMLIGGGTLLAIYLPILIMTSWIGGWLFFIQHQFEETYWESSDNWDRQEAAIHGSSYYHMPKILQWFTGNIGLHHIHHLCSQIPNYRLQECMDDMPVLSEINKITLKKSLKSLSLHVWDEDKQRLVSL